MKITIDSLSNILKPSFNKKRFLLSFIHFAIGVFGLTLTMKFGMLTEDKTAATFLTIIGATFLIYCLFRAAYFVNYQILSELKENKTPDYTATKTAFKKQQWQLLLMPILVAAVLLLEYLIFLGIEDMGDRTVIQITKLLFLSPFFIVNLAMFIFLVLGGGLFIPIMIDQKLGAIETFKAMLTLIKQQFVRVLRTQFFAVLIVGTALFLGYHLISFAIQPHGASMFRKEIFGTLVASIGFPFFNSVTGIIIQFLFILNSIIIMGVGIAYLFNLNMAVYSSFYLDLKQHLTFPAATSNQPVENNNPTV